MSQDDTADGEQPEGVDASGTDVRDRIERGADRAAEQFDEGVVELLSWVLDTETRARLYITLRQQPDSTSEEVADEAGLYPSTVREALAALHEDGLVDRRKRESDGAGNNPYEYAALAPSDLVSEVVEDVQDRLNAVVNLDQYLGNDGEQADTPVTITVDRGDD